MINRRSLLAALALAALPLQARAAGSDPLRNFSLSGSAKPVPALEFMGLNDEKVALSAYRGKLVLLNVWATWCAPCVKEMPSLDRLAALLADAPFAILPVSLDAGGLPDVQEFYKVNALTRLPALVDPTRSIARSLRPRGLPFTLLIDKDGNEIGRALGEAEWDAPEALALLRRYLPQQ